MSSLDELDEYEAELELRLKKEYTAVFGLFRYCVVTQDSTYLCNKLDLKSYPQSSYPFFHLTMEDVWVWDKNRPTRIIPILYDNPHEVGPDRIVNSVAAKERYGTPCVVVDFGTSTNFDAVSRAGEYLGGVLAPGIEISMEALFARAARLVKIDFVEPPAVIGKTTVGGLQSGLVYGFAGQVDGIVDRMRAELGSDVRVIATGGLAGLIAPHSRTIERVDEDLTLEGLRLVWELNEREPQ